MMPIEDATLDVAPQLLRQRAEQPVDADRIENGDASLMVGFLPDRQEGSDIGLQLRLIGFFLVLSNLTQGRANAEIIAGPLHLGFNLVAMACQLLADKRGAHADQAIFTEPPLPTEIGLVLIDLRQVQGIAGVHGVVQQCCTGLILVPQLRADGDSKLAQVDVGAIGDDIFRHLFLFA
jgi:hypothetical protein